MSDSASHPVKQSSIMIDKPVVDWQEHYRQLVRLSFQNPWAATPEGRIYWIGDLWEQWTGQSPEEVFQDGWLGVVHPDDLDRAKRARFCSVRDQALFDCSFRVRFRSGEHRWVRARGLPHFDAEGRFLGWYGMTDDINDQRNAEEDLKLNEARFRSAYEYSGIGMTLISLQGRFMQANPSLCHFLGYAEQDLLKLDFQTITHPDDLQRDLDYVRKVLDGELATYSMEKRYRHRDGFYLWGLLTVSLVRDEEGQPLHFISQIQDISERKNAEERTLRTLRERETLLREIHHRVKNNLTVIVSLLGMQSRRSKDDRVRDALTDTQNRVQSMVTVHEMLYGSDDFTQIDLRAYLRRLASNLLGSYACESRVALMVNVPPGAVDLDTALPIGLLLTELISNALKHAFPGGRRGTVTVSVEYQEDAVRLTIRDDGIGFPEKFDAETSPSMGMKLVSSLTRQLNGRLTIHREVGSEFCVEFRLPKSRASSATD